MSLIPFWNFNSEVGDQFEFRVTEDNKIYFFHMTNKGEFVNSRPLKGENDREKIENGITDIGDFLKNLSSIEPTIDLILQQLEAKKREMNWL